MAKQMKTIDGNTAAAHVAYAMSDAAELQRKINDSRIAATTLTVTASL